MDLTGIMPLNNTLHRSYVVLGDTTSICFSNLKKKVATVEQMTSMMVLVVHAMNVIVTVMVLNDAGIN